VFKKIAGKLKKSNERWEENSKFEIRNSKSLRQKPPEMPPLRALWAPSLSDF
jgi:hypothetical protein